MYLPDAEHATVAPEKVTEYLLVPEHRDNKGKAAFLFRYGFTKDAWAILAVALITHGGTHPITDTRERPGGTLYEVRGDMTMPGGRVRRVLTAWFVPNEGGAPRFVTAYPA